MPYKMKQKTPETGVAATTDSLVRQGEASGERTALGPDQDGGPAARERGAEQIAMLASCAEILLTSDSGKLEDAFTKMAPALSLDAYACFVANGGDYSFSFESARGLSEVALSGSAIAGIVADLTLAERRTLVLPSLPQSDDVRATVFRDLGFASAVIGALVDGDHVLGAVVFASRSKERFTAVEIALIDTVVCYMTAALERRELARHRHSAEQRKREFLTVLAHELRNPLAPVRNALEIMRANDRARSHVEHSAYAMIERQLQQIGRLADDLLDANQVVLGHIELEKQRVLLDAVIQRAASQSRPWIDAARHTLVVDLPREAIALDADPKRLARVFSNLVNNAARRMDRGGRIVISAEARERSVVVFVRARGRTVSGESLNGIFADAVAHSEVADGQSQGAFTAGMTLVKHLVEMHGGAVSARTDTDGVEVFEVRLPIVHASLLQRTAAQPSAEDAVERRTPQRILIADDNADSAESMGMLLRLMGNDVRIASDGLEAVEQAAVFQPDIVLLDIGMPRLDGYEAARQIRNQGWSRDTLLVAVTGWGPSDGDAQATAAGFDRHFTKPLDPAELRRLVTETRPH
jgi:signal transduction histidine kinase/ActR/RegA family two-component response regulator